MTGPQHYRMAEELIANAANLDFPSDEYAQTLAESQVHATLALAAAAGVGRPSLAEGEAWQEVAGTARESMEQTSWYWFQRDLHWRTHRPGEKAGDD